MFSDTGGKKQHKTVILAGRKKQRGRLLHHPGFLLGGTFRTGAQQRGIQNSVDGNRVKFVWSRVPEKNWLREKDFQKSKKESHSNFLRIQNCTCIN